MLDLIGRPYRLGGGDGTIDCIQLVYEVLGRLEIPTPTFDPGWYDASARAVARALLQWGKPVRRPTYDGDVALLRHSGHAFAVTWQQGLLYINQRTEAVAWCPIGQLEVARVFRCSRMNES